jgi:hypothetical protein
MRIGISHARRRLLALAAAAVTVTGTLLAIMASGLRRLPAGEHQRKRQMSVKTGIIPGCVFDISLGSQNGEGSTILTANNMPYKHLTISWRRPGPSSTTRC